MIAGELHAQAVERRRQVGSTDLHTVEQLLAGGFDFRGHGGDLILTESHAGERRRFQGKWLGFRSAFERHFACGNGAFLHAVDGLAGDAVEQENHATFVHGDDGGNGFAALRHVDERGCAGQVGIPNVMMDDLKVPQIFACVGIGRDQAVTEQIVADAVTAVLVDGRRAEGHVDNAALFVQGEEAPNVHT